MSANNRYFRYIARGALLGAAAIVTASCGGALPDPEKVSVAMAPKGMPTRNLTSFSDALRCMDNLFLEHKKHGYILTSTSMNDATGKLSLGVRDMLMTTISTMSATSGAITYLDQDQGAGPQGGQDSVTYLSQMLKDQQKARVIVPQAYIRGSISQVDDQVMSGKQGAALTTGIIDIGGSQDRSVSSVTMDMLLMDMASRTNMPGIQATNMLAVSRASKGMDAGISGGKIVKAGIQFNVSQDSTESSGQAVRTLVQLGMIELIGKWTKVPYWTCLEIENNNPEVRKQLREWYDRITPPDRIKFIQAGLKGSGHYQGNVDGQDNPGLRSAIAKYQTERSLVPNGNVSFEVYEALMQGKINLSALPAEPPKPSEIIISDNPIDIRLTSDQAVYRPNENLVLTLAISRNGYPYCYYRDENNVISKIYPNRYQLDKQLQGNQPIIIPPKRDSLPEYYKGFNLTIEHANKDEEVVCLASEADLSTILPKEWTGKELTPLNVRSLDDLINIAQDLTSKTTNNRQKIAYKKLPIKVKK